MSEPSNPSPYVPLVVLLGVLVVGAVVLRGGRDERPTTAPVPMPPLYAEGWLNTPMPVSNESLEGKVVLLDAWFYQCGYCRQAMPELAELNSKLQDEEDFLLLGATTDSVEDPSIPLVDYVESVEGFDWPVAYGAQPIIDALGIRMFPTLMVFGRDGRAVYRGHDVREAESVVRELLAN